MRTIQWKLLPGFLLGLLILLSVGCAVGTGLAVHPGLMKLHWGIWLALTLVFPILALWLHVKGGEVRAVYVLSYLLNLLGASFAFGVALAYLDMPLRAGFLSSTLLSIVFPAGLAVVLCLVYTLCRRDRIVAYVFTFLGVAAIVLSFLFLVKWDPVTGLGACFGFLFFLALPIACGKLRSDPWNALEHLSYSGFGAYLFVLMGAIVVLFEDGPDGVLEGMFDGVSEVSDFMNEPAQKKKNHP